MSALAQLEAMIDKPKLGDFYNTFSQLHMLLSSGTTLQQALLEVSKDQPNKSLATALKNISRNLSSGISISVAIQREGIFPKFVAPTIEVGNQSGQLPQTFLRLSELMWMQHKLYSKVNNALFIPKIAAVIMILMIVAYIKIAVPEYVKLYEENDIALPWIVGAVTSTVNGIVDYWFITLFVLFLIYKGIKFLSGRYPETFSLLKLRMPIYSQLHFAFLQHQFSSNLNLMLSSGLTAPDSLVQVGKIVENIVMSRSINRVREDILKGNTLSASLKRNNGIKIFDNMLIASVSAGEKSSHLSDALNQISRYYERMIDNMVDPITTKITLVVMLPMGMFIVLIFMFTLIPMFDYIGKVSSV